MNYPWHTDIWQNLGARYQAGTLPHALLLCGQAGLGKHIFARTFAKRLLCQTPTVKDEACGSCHACHLFQAESHPDFLWVSPEEKSTVIKVNQIRPLVDFVAKTPQQGRCRVIVIHPAHAMNLSAANSVLKTLEEPTAHTFVFLIAEHPSQLPATVASRCQRVVFPVPALDVARAWLTPQLPKEIDVDVALGLAQGAPLRALAYAQSDEIAQRDLFCDDLFALASQTQQAVAVSEKWKSQELSWVLDVLWLTIKDILASQVKPESAARYQAISRKNLLDYFDHVQSIRQHVASRLNLNAQLVLDELFIKWSRLCR